MRRFMVWMLCAALVLSNVFTLPVMAADEESDTGQETTQGEQGTRKIKVNKSNISFGTVTEGDSVEPKEFQVINNGDVPVYIDWKQADSNNAFEVTALSGVGSELKPGKSAQFRVSLNDVSEGDYSTNIIIQDEDDPPVKAEVSVSAKVKAPEPEPEPEPEPQVENTQAEDPQVDDTQAEDPQVDDTQAEDPQGGDTQEGDTQADPQGDDTQERDTQTDPQGDDTQEGDTQTDPQGDDTQEGDTQTDPQGDDTREEDTQKKDTRSTESTRSTRSTEEKVINAYHIRTVCRPAAGGYSSGDGLYSRKDSARLIAFENVGYEFVGWYLNGKKISSKTSCVVKEIRSNLTYTAKFRRIYCRIRVKSKNPEFGTVSGGGSVAKGKSAVVKAKAKKGYRFAGWYEDGILVSKKPVYKVKSVVESHGYVAVFKPKKHNVNVTVSPKEAGKVTGAGKYDTGANAKLKAEPEKGYVFKGYAINNNIISENPSFTLKKINRDVSVTAYFVKEKEKTYVIKSGIANKGGSISPSGEIEIREHGSITYTFAPDNGYAVQEISVDGKKIGPAKSYTFEDIREDHKISVAFAPIKGNEKKVKKDPIITEEEAARIAVDSLKEAGEDSDRRYSEIVTPEAYQKMKEEGTLDEVLKIPDQEVVGMDDAQSLPDEVEGYNYDEAEGLYQTLDITPDEAKEMVESGDDERIIREAYEAGYLTVLINNQYLVPGNETEMHDVFEDDTTIKNMLEFVSGVLTKEDEYAMLSGKKMAVTFGVTRGDDFTDEEKELMAKSGADINEYFHMTVLKQKDKEESQLVTELSKPVRIILPSPEGSTSNCIVRLHNGKTTILSDLDDDPETITIETDEFSPYAFGTQKKSGMALPIVGGIAAAAVAAIIAAVLLKKRRG